MAPRLLLRTERALESLRREGWRFRHDLEDKYGNIDHLAVGPGGVFLLDSKNLVGSLAIEAGVLTCHHQSSPRSDYSLPKLPGSIAAAARGLDRRIQDHLGWIVDVRPVVVLWADFPAGEGDVAGVGIVLGDRLVDFLRGQPGRIAPKDLDAVWAAVELLRAAEPDLPQSPVVLGGGG